LPSVNRLYREFKDQGFEVLLISFRESADRVKRTVAERGYVAPVLLDATGDVTGRDYGVWGPPTAYLVDREGRLVGRMVGVKDWSGAPARDLIRSLVTPPAR
jgi:peroxiredoxin